MYNNDPPYVADSGASYRRETGARAHWGMYSVWTQTAMTAQYLRQQTSDKYLPEKNRKRERRKEERGKREKSHTAVKTQQNSSTTKTINITEFAFQTPFKHSSILSPR